MTVKTLEKTILHLEPAQRLRIVEKILNSLNKPDLDIERAWARESDRRLKAYKRGAIKAIPLETIKKRYGR